MSSKTTRTWFQNYFPIEIVLITDNLYGYNYTQDVFKTKDSAEVMPVLETIFVKYKSVCLRYIALPIEVLKLVNIRHLCCGRAKNVVDSKQPAIVY